MKVYFVRHGESVLNAREIHQVPDAELSSEGIRQAQALRDRFSRISVDSTLTSPYLRAQQTAEIINEVAAKQIEVIEDLRERKRPTAIENLSVTDPYAISVNAEVATHRHDPSWHYADEENFFDLRSRAARVIQLLEGRQEESLLVVTHDYVLGMITAGLLLGDHASPEVVHELIVGLKMKNTGITVFEKQHDERWKLLTWNDHAHLG